MRLLNWIEERLGELFLLCGLVVAKAIDLIYRLLGKLDREQDDH